MAYSVKRHEVDRLLGHLLALGWELVSEDYDERGVTLVIRRELSLEILRASGEVGDLVNKG